MTNVINLNKTRKAKARTDEEKQAAENRCKFGQTKGEKQKKKLETSKFKEHLDGHKRETDNLPKEPI
jgi:hypothetical protein